MMRIFVATVVVFGLCCIATAEQPWFYYYKLGIENSQNQQFDTALTALQKAVELNSTPSSHARTYGMNFIEYYPYFYMAVCYYGTGAYADAKKALDQEFSAGAINQSKDMFNKAYGLKGRIEAQLKPKITPPPVQPPVTKPPENNDNTQPPPIVQKPPENPPEDNQNNQNPLENDLKRNSAIMRQALTHYFNGDYSQTITTLNQLPDSIPRHLSMMKNFFLGSSYASLYYLDGEKDSSKINSAKSYFNQIERLPPLFKMKYVKFISPRIISLFQSTKTGAM